MVPAMIETFDGPPFRSPAEVRSEPYRREPYVHATLPDGSTVDAKVVRWSPSHVLLHWQDDPAGPHREAWVPGPWCERIDREEGVFVRARLSRPDARRFAQFLVLEEDASQEAGR